MRLFRLVRLGAKTSTPAPWPNALHTRFHIAMLSLRAQPPVIARPTLHSTRVVEETNKRVTDQTRAP